MPQDPPPPPDSLEESDDSDVVRDWRLARFEEMGYDYPTALELAIGRVDWHAARKLAGLIGDAGYDDSTAREMTAEILR